MNSLWRFLCDEEGTTAVEYAVMLAMIILVCFVTIGLIGSASSSNFNTTAVTTALGSASS
ncbi:MAG: Flp family type IVb pilin [Gemmataceae bacterium]